MDDQADGKVYQYTGLRRLGIFFSQIAGIFAIIFFNIIGFGILILAAISDKVSVGLDFLHSPMTTILCLSLGMFGFSWLFGSFFINHSPTIWVKDEGIVISYYIVFRRFIPWTGILGVIDHRWLFTNRTLVIAKRISLYHRIISFVYYLRREPCFEIGNDIEERGKLVTTIRNMALLHSGYYRF